MGAYMKTQRDELLISCNLHAPQLKYNTLICKSRKARVIMGCVLLHSYPASILHDQKKCQHTQSTAYCLSQVSRELCILPLWSFVSCQIVSHQLMLILICKQHFFVGPRHARYWRYKFDKWICSSGSWGAQAQC